MNSLRDLIHKYGSDKNDNQYTPIYHTIFNPIKNKNINILEIGIGTMIPNAPSSMLGYGSQWYKPGASLRAFRDFFPNAIKQIPHQLDNYGIILILNLIS